MANAAPHLNFFQRAWQGLGQEANVPVATTPAPNPPAMTPAGPPPADPTRAWSAEAQAHLTEWARTQQAAGATPANTLAYLRAQVPPVPEAAIQQAFAAVGLAYTPPLTPVLTDPATPATPPPFTWTKPRVALAAAGGIFLLAITWFAVSRVRGRAVSGPDQDLDTYDDEESER